MTYIKNTSTCSLIIYHRMSFIYASNSIASVVLLFLILLIYFLECYVQIKFPQRKKPIKKRITLNPYNYP